MQQCNVMSRSVELDIPVNRTLVSPMNEHENQVGFRCSELSELVHSISTVYQYTGMVCMCHIFGTVSHLLSANHYKCRTIPNTRRGFFLFRNILAEM